MGIPTPDEFRHKLTISWGLAVAYTIVLVLASFTFGSMLDDDQQREELKKHYDEKIADQRAHFEQRISELREFLVGEIIGHRDDCDRRFDEVIAPALEKNE